MNKIAKKNARAPGAKVVTKKSSKQNRYATIIAEVFLRHYRPGLRCVSFDRSEFEGIAKKKRIELPKNLGDAIYSFKYRCPLPASITKTAPKGFEWIISGAGRSKYQFRLVKPLEIVPSKSRLVVKLPDATPEIIVAYSLGDEQALLAKVRYNRMIDIFLGISASSLQNHLRTTVKEIGQIEIDELYVGIDRNGCQFIVPVQAKGGSDKHGRQQTEQDLAWCAQKFPQLKCRPVSAQFITPSKIAMFELCERGDEILVASEEHYELVAAEEITPEDLNVYAGRVRSR